MKTFSGRPASQREDELKRFIEVLQRMGVQSYLEIGARHGDTFHAVMSSLPPGSCGLAVDLPGGAWGQDGSDTSLSRACDDLKAQGYRIDMLLGDCGSPELVARIRSNGVFDACLIDADHRYDAVMRDFEIYSKKARLVALHDIDGFGQLQKTSKLPVEVPRAWAEIQVASWLKGEPTVEIVGAEHGMGIGVVCVDPALRTLFESAVEAVTYD